MHPWRLTAVLLATLSSSAIAQQAGGARVGAGWLGLGLSCENCSIVRPPRETGATWQFRSGYPSVMWVDSDGPAHRAGLRSGDTLTAIDGLDLLTTEGGRAFGSVQPRQRIELAYRRDGRAHRARITVAERPESEAVAALTDVTRARVDSVRRAALTRSAEIRRAQQEMSRAQRELTQLQRELSRNQGARLDSLRRRILVAESTLAAAAAAQGYYGYSYSYPTPPVVTPLVPTPASRPRGKDLPGLTPAPPAPPVTWTVPRASPLPTPGISSYSTAWMRDPRTITSEQFTSFGRLRYSGRMEDVVIEARAPGAVNAVEEGDSVVVITSGDMSVRVLLRPRAPRADEPDSAEAVDAPAPARPTTPRPAPRPRPAAARRP